MASLGELEAAVRRITRMATSSGRAGLVTGREPSQQARL